MSGHAMKEARLALDNAAVHAKGKARVLAALFDQLGRHDETAMDRDAAAGCEQIALDIAVQVDALVDAAYQMARTAAEDAEASQ
jgi:hypothetical protein